MRCLLYACIAVKDVPGNLILVKICNHTTQIGTGSTLLSAKPAVMSLSMTANASNTTTLLIVPTIGKVKSFLVDSQELPEPVERKQILGLAKIIRHIKNLKRQERGEAPAHIISEFAQSLQFHVATCFDNQLPAQPRALVAVLKAKKEEAKLNAVERESEDEHEAGDDMLWMFCLFVGGVRYALDVNVERAEDVLVHKRLLQLAEDPANRPAFEVHLVQWNVWPKQMYPVSNGKSVHSVHSDSGTEEDAQSSYFVTRQGIHTPPTFGSSTKLEALAFQATSYHVEDGDDAVNSTLNPYRPMHEITFSAVDRPKLLRQMYPVSNGKSVDSVHSDSGMEEDGQSSYFVTRRFLLNCRNNKKLRGRVRAFGRHCNMVYQ